MVNKPVGIVFALFVSAAAMKTTLHNDCSKCETHRTLTLITF